MAEHDNDETRVQIQYFQGPKLGESYDVPLRVALTEHREARIVAHADGTAWVGKEDQAEVKETKAEIREERAAERAAVAPTEDETPKRTRKPDGD